MSIEKYVPAQIYLEENELPESWYNLRADLKNIEPYLDKNDNEITVNDMSNIFSKELSKQEFSNERYIKIPEEVREIYKIYRATPLHRAYRLEKILGTPAKLYYKYEGVNPSGSHKLNTAIPQVFYNVKEGITRLTTETGAGQWGTALSAASAMLGASAEVFMVKISAEQKKARADLIKCFGAKLHKSPTNETEIGRKILANDKECVGSLGTAVSEAIEVALKSSNAKYALGSVLNHVCLHQTIIGEEAIKQFKKIGEYPDSVIACCGGGSNFAGTAFSFIKDKIYGRDIDIVGVEPLACPTLTKGKYAYDFGDTAGFTPKMLQYTLGSGFMPPKLHCGGLRYHGMNSLVSRAVHDNLARAVAVKQNDVFKAAIEFTKAECILPAPESAHAICEAINQALECKKTGQPKTILFTVSGHGQFDTKAYEEYKNKTLIDVDFTEEQLQIGFNTIPKTNYKFKN